MLFLCVMETDAFGSNVDTRMYYVEMLRNNASICASTVLPST